MLTQQEKDKLNQFIQSKSSQTRASVGLPADQLNQYAVGAGKGIFKTITGIPSFFERIGRKISGDFGGKSLGVPTTADEPTLAEKVIPSDIRTATNSRQGTGMAIEQAAEYLIPGSMSLKAGSKVGAAVRGGEGIASKLAGLGTTSAIEGGLGTLQSGFQSGKLGKEEAQIGGISLIAPIALAGGGKLLSKVLPTETKVKFAEALRKAIKPSKKSLQNPNFTEVAAKGFQVIKQNLPEGQTPRTVGETLESLKVAKENVFRRYDDIAKQSGEVGVKVSVKPVAQALDTAFSAKGYSQGIKDYAAKRVQELADLEGASPSLIQDRIQELNSNINFFTSGSDKLKNQIDLSIANKLRNILDETIFNSTGLPYQQIRSEYAALKTIEDDMARTAANLARRNEKGILDVTDIFTGGDILSGVISGNPASIAKGLFGRALKDYYKYLNSPDKNLREIWKIIDKLPTTKAGRVPTQRLLPAGVTTGVRNEVPINLPARSQSTVDAQEMLRLQSQRPKGNVAKTTQTTLEKEATKYKTAEEFVKANDLGTAGVKFHITDNPNFKINENVIPSDLPAGKGTKKVLNKVDFEKQLLNDVKIFRERKIKTESEIEQYLKTQRKIYKETNGGGGLMVTRGLEPWLEKNVLSGNRKYVAVIDTGNVPLKDMTRSTRGFGDEIFIQNPKNARVIKVVPIDEALKIQKQSRFTKSQLTDIWNKANKKIK